MSHPRARELVLLMGAVVVYFLGYAQIGVRALTGLAAYVLVLAAMHAATRFLAPAADPLLLPLAGLLVGLGLLELAAIDVAKLGPESTARPLAQAQSGWLAISALGFIATLYIFRRGLGVAWSVRYTIALVGIAALLSPLLPGIGRVVNGARLWLRFGPASFQPGEAAKILLVLFFAAYLAERRELLWLGTRRIGPIELPDPRYAAPLLGTTLLALLIFVGQNDLGSSLLFFVLFMAILWIATGKAVFPITGFALFAGGVYFSLQVFGHVRGRFESWLAPFDHAQTTGFQIAQGWYAMAEGGVGGAGFVAPSNRPDLLAPQPDLIPFGSTDLILAAIGYSIGLAGLLAVVVCYVLLLTRTFYISLRSKSELHALAAAGFGVIIGTQTALIAGGVLRILPLTGVTLPFVSYGGSSLLANFVMLGCLLAISNAEQTTILERPDTEPEPVPVG